MKTITELAEEYSVAEEPQLERVRMTICAAYLAGAKEMQLRAHAIAFNGNGSDPADCAVNIANLIRKLLPTET